MERMKTILKSGVRSINLVAPDPRCSEAFRKELAASGIRGLVIEQSPRRRDEKSWCDLVVFSRRDRDLIVSHMLLSRVIMTTGLAGDVARAVYGEMCAAAPDPIALKPLMRRHRIGTFYRTREIVAAFASSGLFLPLDGDDGRVRLIPYFYDGSDERVLAARHLMELGYSTRLEGDVFKATLGTSSLTVGFDIDSINLRHRTGDKVMIHPSSPHTHIHSGLVPFDQKAGLTRTSIFIPSKVVHDDPESRRIGQWCVTMTRFESMQVCRILGARMQVLVLQRLVPSGTFNADMMAQILENNQEAGYGKGYCTIHGQTDDEGLRQDARLLLRTWRQDAQRGHQTGQGLLRGEGPGGGVQAGRAQCVRGGPRAAHRGTQGR